MNPYILAADIINWLNHQARYRDFPTWTIWRKFIQNDVLEQNSDIWRYRILITRAVINAKKMSASELVANMLALDAEQMQCLNQAMELYFHILEDGLLEDKIRAFWKDLSNGVVQPAHRGNSGLLVTRFEDQLLKPIIKVPRSWFPLLLFIALDMVVWRFLLATNSPLIFFSQYDNYSDWYDQAMPFYNLFLLPLFAFLLFTFRNYYVKSQTNLKLKPYYSQSPKVISAVVSWQNVLALGFYVFEISVFGGDFFYLNAVVKGLMFHWICRYASLAVPTTAQILKINQSNKFLSTSNMDADENNIEILSFEVTLNNYKTRLDSYLLESALLGALAFGGVLQVASLTGFDIGFSRDFLNTIRSEIYQMVLRIKPNMPLLEKSFVSMEGIGAWISMLSLLCAIFFLAVIASRIWFSKYFDMAYHNLEMAKHFNTIEDNNRANNLSYNHLTDHIRNRLKVTSLACLKLAQIVEYMDINRSLGVLSFFMVVFMTGRFMGNSFFLLLILVYFVNSFFTRQDELILFWQNFKVRLEEFYFSWSKTIERGLWVFLAISTLTLSFVNVEFGKDLYMWFFLSTTAWMLFSLFYPDLELEKQDQSRLGYQDTSLSHIIKTKSLRFAIAMIALTFAFKQGSWSGATIILMIATISTILGSIFTNLLTVYKPWLRVLTGMTIVLSSLQVTFVLMRWPNAQIISNSALVTLCILLLLAKFRLTVFTTYTRNILVVLVVMVICYRFIQTGIPFDINPQYLMLKYEASNIPVLTRNDQDMIEKLNSLPSEEKDKLKLSIYNRVQKRLKILEPVKEHAMNQAMSEIIFIDNLANNSNLCPSGQLILQLKKWPLDSIIIEELDSWCKSSKD
jgi:hypothetical protein